MSRHIGHPGRAALVPPVGPSNFASLKPIWSDWDVLEVKVTRLPPNITTYDLWFAFTREGHVDSVDIFLNRQGLRDGSAKIRFKPPPKHDFLGGEQGRWAYAIDLHDQGQVCYASVLLFRDQKRVYSIKSPVSRDIVYPEFSALDADSLEFGVLRSSHHMLVLSNRQSKEEKKAELGINLRRKQVFVRFKAFQGGQLAEFRLCIPFEHLKAIFQTSDPTGHLFLILNLDTPPHFYRRYRNVEETHNRKSNSWKDENRWYRQTDLEASKQDQQTRSLLPVELKRTKGVIHLGRFTTYCMKFSRDNIDHQKLELVRNMLKDHNIPISQIENFEFSSSSQLSIQPIWGLIEPTDPTPQANTRASFTHELMTDNSNPMFSLSFALRYALEVCISRNFFNEYTLDKEFLKQLTELPEAQAVRLLEYVIHKNQTFVYNPLDIFKLWRPKFPTRQPRLPKNCCMMRSVTVTPTTIIVNAPAVEVTNRVIRQYEHVADRFLRVRFEDDLFRGLRKIYATDEDVMNEIFSKVMRTLSSGLIVGGQKYDFLAYGNSQLRDHGAYFFASTPTISAANIRAWMGRFDHEKIIAKHAARIGQCFSTTRAIRGSKVDPVREPDLVPDIVRNGYNFTDGVGKISRFLAEMIAMELGIQTHAGGPPSLFQFRLSGCKGVLALVGPDEKTIKWNGVGIRKSQFKFESDHHGLEVIRHSEFWSASLNRQLILVLSSLGVEDHVFLAHQEEEIQGLREAMEDDNIAMAKLNEFVDPNHAVMFISHLIADGFRRTNDPFTTSLLRLWRAWRTKDLKERAKLKVKDGAFLLGCIDETATLRGHFNNLDPGPTATYQERVDALPQIFVQVSRLDTPGSIDIVEGVCILARNPSLHPGDIRVVHAIDVPELHHLKDVVVLPQTGDRDLSSMCSGGDLDGDDYIVIWDQSYIPKIWNHTPMDYTPPPPKKVETNVTPFDIMRFFVQYMKNDFLPRIAHAHMAWADFLDEGLTSKKCLELAALHSKAVDYPKTGQPATMEASLFPKSWPHFMQKNKSTYRSTKILGQLYDRVEAVAFKPNYQGQFDSRILNAFDTDKSTFEDAQDLKEAYDEHLSRIMALHEIKTEFEVFATLCLGHSQATKDYKFHEQLGRLSLALKQQFKDECVKRAGGSDYDCLAPYAVAMYKVTKAQLDKALEECAKEGKDPTAKNMPFMSFPWILQNTISEIVSRKRYLVHADKDQEPSSPADVITKSELTDHEDPVLDPQPSINSTTGVCTAQTSFPSDLVEGKWQEASEVNPCQDDEMLPQSAGPVTSPDSGIDSRRGLQNASMPDQNELYRGLEVLDGKKSMPQAQVKGTTTDLGPLNFSFSANVDGKEKGVHENSKAKPSAFRILANELLDDPRSDLEELGDNQQQLANAPIEEDKTPALELSNSMKSMNSADSQVALEAPKPSGNDLKPRQDPADSRIVYTSYEEPNIRKHQSSLPMSASMSSFGSQSDNVKSLGKVDSEPTTTNLRRRRRYGSGRTPSGSGRSNPGIEALLAQADVEIQRRQKRTNSADSNIIVDVVDRLRTASLSAPHSEEAETGSPDTKWKPYSPDVAQLSNPSSSGGASTTKESSRLETESFENKPPPSHSTVPPSTVRQQNSQKRVTAVPERRIIESKADEAELEAEEFVPGRRGRTAMERLENLVNRH